MSARSRVSSSLSNVKSVNAFDVAGFVRYDRASSGGAILPLFTAFERWVRNDYETSGWFISRKLAGPSHFSLRWGSLWGRFFKMFINRSNSSWAYVRIRDWNKNFLTRINILRFSSPCASWLRSYIVFNFCRYACSNMLAIFLLTML